MGVKIYYNKVATEISELPTDYIAKSLEDLETNYENSHLIPLLKRELNKRNENQIPERPTY